MKQINIRLPRPLIKQLDEEKTRNQRPVQAIVKTALGAYFALPEKKRAVLHLELIEKEAA